jgi:hypothetical protein
MTLKKPRFCTKCSSPMEDVKGQYRLCSPCRVNREKTKRQYSRKLVINSKPKIDTESWYEKKFGHKRDNSSAGSGYE